MPLISIPTFATGDTIEAAWANDLRDNGLLLDARTGGDPGGSAKLLVSSGSLGATWTAALAAILTGLGFTPVNRAGDTMTGTLNGTTFNATGNVLAGGVVNSTGSMSVGTTITVSGSGGVGGSVSGSWAVNGDVSGTSVTSSGAMTKGGVTVLNQTEGDARWAAIADKVPLGAVVFFESTAELLLAGAAWQRHTAADGKLLVGAGASGSGQTFTEGTNFGSTWTPAASVSVTNGTLAAGVGTLGISVTGGPFGAATHNAAVGAGLPISPHTHTGSVTGSPALTGAVGFSGQNTVWLPPMRAGVWGRHI